MRNLLHTICILFLFGSVWAQRAWFPIGAEWHYQGKYNSYVQGNVITDTIIHDTLAKVINYTRHTALGVQDYGSEYVAQIGNQIYFYDRYNTEFFKLYDFDAKVGDTIVIRDKEFYGVLDNRYEFQHYYKEPIYSYTILKIDTIDVGGEKLIRQYTSSTEGTLAFYYITELMGSTLFLTGHEGIICRGDGYCPAVDAGLRCYTDDRVQYFFVDDCKSLDDPNNVVDVEAIDEQDYYFTNEYMLVFNTEKSRIVSLHSMAGTLLANKTLSEIEMHMSFNAYKGSGVCILQIESNSGVSYIKLML